MDFDNVSNAELSYDYFVQLLFSVPGMVAIIVLLFLMAALFFSPRLRWVVLASLLYICTMGFHIRPWYRTEVLPPFEWLRHNGRPLCIGLLISLIPVAVLSVKGWRTKLIGAGAVTFFLFEVVFSARVALGGYGIRGNISILIFAAIFSVFAFGLSRWLQTLAEINAAINTMAAAGIVFLGATLVCLVTNSSGIIWNGRLIGITQTSTYCAETIATLILPVLYLVVRPGVRPWWRVVWASCTGFLLILLVWCGTRTGALMFLVGAGLMFRFRIGRLLGAGIAVAVFVIVAASLFSSSTIGAERLLSTEDTRSITWAHAWELFKAGPLIGTTSDSASGLVVENSYLAAAANTGLAGLTVLGLAIYFVIRDLVRLQRVRKQLGPHALLADLVSGGIASIGVGAILEGYLLGTLVVQVFALYIYLALLEFLLDCANASAQTEQHETSYYDSLQMEQPMTATY